MGAILGLSRVEGRLKKYLAQVEPAIIEAARITQSLVANSARQIVPVRTSALQHSIQESLVELRGTVVRAHVVALQDYASYVEKGTSRQKKQPYLKPSMEKHQPDFVRLLKRAMKP